MLRLPYVSACFGGGCDHPSYFLDHGCTIISFAINCYMHVIWNPRPTGGCRLSYSEIEEVNSLTECKHTLVKAAANRWGIKEPCTLTIVSDVPKGTGLGSSSALAVCLAKMFSSARLQHDLHQQAVRLEQFVSPHVGFQDSLPAVYGGFNSYTKAKGTAGGIHIEAIEPTEIIFRFGLLLYTGVTRDANDMLVNWHGSESLPEIQRLAEEQVSLKDFWAPRSLGPALNRSWELKASVPGVVTPTLREQHSVMMKAGALGAKLLGAGGGGCWFVLVPPESRKAVIASVGLLEIPFRIENRGVQEWEL